MRDVQRRRVEINLGPFQVTASVARSDFRGRFAPASLLPFCYPTAQYGAEHGSTKALADTQKGQLIQTYQYWMVGEGITVAEFRVRCFQSLAVRQSNGYIDCNHIEILCDSEDRGQRSGSCELPLDLFQLLTQPNRRGTINTGNVTPSKKSSQHCVPSINNYCAPFTKAVDEKTMLPRRCPALSSGKQDHANLRVSY